MDLHEPSVRRAKYDGQTAQYLVELHDAKAVFDFCGGMRFQLVLSDKLRSQLASVGDKKEQQPVVHSAATNRMQQMPDYAQSAEADNVRLFHGRNVPNAAGGMNFVLELVSFDGDPEGWSPQELGGYDGWGHDASRTWRKGDQLEAEGVEAFESKFGAAALTLNHRFYWHLDRTDQLWLSAEDGCEGRLLSAASGGSRSEL